MIARLQNQISEAQATAFEEHQSKLNFQMISDSKDAEIELLHEKIKELQSNSINRDLKTITLPNTPEDVENMRLEGYLSIPNKQNIRKHGWRRQYVVVSSRKIIFYNSEQDKAKADPVLILDLSKLFHVRSVTQGDVIRADGKEIPRIFQLLYAGEGESRRPTDTHSLDGSMREVSLSQVYCCP